MDLLDIAKEYWTIIFFFGSLVAFIAGMNMRINRLEDKQTKMSKRIDKHKAESEKKFNEIHPMWLNIEARLAGIEATLEYIKKKQ